MATVVLVHGAWHGGWCWEHVVLRLEQAGHTVFAPTLSGLGERSAQLTPELGLTDHIQDVSNLLEIENLYDVFLVVHSYAGMIGRVLEDNLPHRLHSVAYMEAAVPENGEALIDLVPADFKDQLVATAKRDGDGWKLPPPDPERFGISDPELKRSVVARLTDQPLKSFFDPVALKPESGFTGPRHYLYATDRTPNPYAPYIDQFSADPAWRVSGFQGGHGAMMTNPEGLADLLLDLVT